MKAVETPNKPQPPESSPLTPFEEEEERAKRLEAKLDILITAVQRLESSVLQPVQSDKEEPDAQDTDSLEPENSTPRFSNLLDLWESEPALVTNALLSVFGFCAAFGLVFSQQQEAAIVAMAGAVLALLAGLKVRSKVTSPKTSERDSG